MQSINRRYDPNLLATLNLLRTASCMGFLYCMVALLHGSYIDTKAIMLYMLWFVVCWLSTTIMKLGDIFGAYALGIATIAIAIYELINGIATLGGAMLGTTVILIVIYYIANTAHDNPTKTRLTN